ncbi:hypothetical protein ACMFMG_004772 [Clarireedia jacksonii]
MGPAHGIPTSQFTNLRLEEAQGLISAVQEAKDETPWSSLLGLDNITDSNAGTNDNLINWTPDTATVPNSLSQYPAIGHWHEQTTDHSTLDSTKLYIPNGINQNTNITLKPYYEYAVESGGIRLMLKPGISMECTYEILKE